MLPNHSSLNDNDALGKPHEKLFTSCYPLGIPIASQTSLPEPSPHLLPSPLPRPSKYRNLGRAQTGRCSPLPPPPLPLSTLPRYESLNAPSPLTPRTSTTHGRFTGAADAPEQGCGGGAQEAGAHRAFGKPPAVDWVEIHGGRGGDTVAVGGGVAR